MSNITVNRGETRQLPFTITDVANSLIGKRVTWVVGTRTPSGATRLLSKASALPGSSVDITITTQTAQQISGTINLAVADFTSLTELTYHASLWIDDGTKQYCVTPGGHDVLRINPAVPRT